MEAVNLSNYGMYLNHTSIKIEPTMATINLELSLSTTSLDSTDASENLDRFFLDLKLLNTLRGSTSPAVQKHYEELLILLALSGADTKKDK